MTEYCENVGFSELVACFEEGGYKKAWGWTASTGQIGPYLYTPPEPWEYDPLYPDESGPIGSHGGCPDCIMTLVHLRRLLLAPKAVSFSSSPSGAGVYVDDVYKGTTPLTVELD